MRTEAEGLGAKSLDLARGLLLQREGEVSESRSPIKSSMDSKRHYRSGMALCACCLQRLPAGSCSKIWSPDAFGHDGCCSFRSLYKRMQTSEPTVLNLKTSRTCVDLHPDLEITGVPQGSGIPHCLRGPNPALPREEPCIQSPVLGVGAGSG